MLKENIGTSHHGQHHQYHLREFALLTGVMRNACALGMLWDTLGTLWDALGRSSVFDILGPLLY